ARNVASSSSARRATVRNSTSRSVAPMCCDPTTSSSSKRGSFEHKEMLMTVERALKVLWLRRATLIGTVLVALSIAAVGSLLAPKTYVAELTLVIDIKGGDPLAETTLSWQLLSTYIASQREI